MGRMEMAAKDGFKFVNEDMYEALETNCIVMETRNMALERERDELKGRIKKYFDAYGPVDEI